MRLLPLTTASAFALSASVAFAQVTPPAPGHISGAPAAPAPTPQMPQRVPAGNPLAQPDVSKIGGTGVWGSDGKKIGTVAVVLMNPQSKRIDRLVVAAGGVLGVGAHRVALPLADFRWDQRNDGFIVNRTGDELRSMADWQNPNETAGSGSSLPPDTMTPSSPGATAAPTH